MSEENIEREAFELAREYLKCYRGNWKIKLPKLSNAKNSKFWKFFLKSAELYSGGPEWSPRAYAKFTFENYPMNYPHILQNKKIWQAYKDEYIPTTTEQEERILVDMLATHKAMKDWLKRKNKNYKEFMDENWIQVKRGMFSFYYLSVLQPFLEKYKLEVNKPIPEKELKTKRIVTLSYRKVKEILKKEMGEYFSKEQF